MTETKEPLLGRKVLPWWLALGCFGAVLVLYVLIDRALHGADVAVPVLAMPPSTLAVDPDQLNYPVVGRTQDDFIITPPEG